MRPLPLLPLAAALALATPACSSAEWHPVSVPFIPAAPPAGAQQAKAAHADHDSDDDESPKPSAAKQAAPSGGGKAISGDLPQGIEGKLEVDVVCAEKTCGLAGLLPAGITPDKAAPAAAWSVSFPKGNSAYTTPRDARVDIYGLVVKGEVKVRGVEEGGSQKLGAWGVFHAPGGAVHVQAQKPDTRVVLVAVSDGAPLADLLKAKDTKGAAWKKRPKPVETRELGKAQDLAWGGGSMHARVGFEGEGQRASVGLLMASPDAPVAQHKHDTSWEVLVALEAAGTFKLAAEGGNEARPIGDGKTTVVPKGALHEWVPGGTKPLVALQLYAPPGPEQRFKAMAGQGK